MTRAQEKAEQEEKDERTSEAAEDVEEDLCGGVGGSVRRGRGPADQYAGPHRVEFRPAGWRGAHRVFRRPVHIIFNRVNFKAQEARRPAASRLIELRSPGLFSRP